MLLSILEARKSLLETKIDESSSLEQVEGLLDEDLDAIWTEYLSEGHLTISQERLAYFFRITVQLSVSVWTHAIKQAHTYTPPQPPQPPSSPPFEDMSGPAASESFGFIRRLLRVFLKPDKETEVRTPPVPAESTPERGAPDNGGQDARNGGAQQELSLRIDGRSFVQRLEGVLKSVDDAIGKQEAAAAEAASSEPVQIENFSEVLDFFQEMMCEIMTDNAQLTLKRAKELPRILKNLGIRVEVYRPNDDAAFEKFDFEPSIYPSLTEHVTQMPAFVNGARVIRRGRVIEPFKQD